MKKKIQINNFLFLFLGAAAYTAIIFGPFLFFGKDTYIRLFLYRTWPIQIATTYLFGVALAFMVLRFINLQRELKVADLIDVQTMSTISSDHARKELDRVPAGLRETVGYRRVSELMRGYLNGEEIIRLNEELSRRDNEQIDRGYALLDSLRQLIPVIGFLGTILGLALGMVAFPESMAKTVSIDSLRETLKTFSAALSVKFETTLLALGYTIIVILFTSLLKEREAQFVARIDRFAREIVSKFRSHHSSVVSSGTGVGSEFESLLNGWLDRWEIIFKRHMTELVQGLKGQK